MKRIFRGMVVIVAMTMLAAPAVLAAKKPRQTSSVAPSTIRVAVYDDEVNGDGNYFQGFPSNSYDVVQGILNSDPMGRFTATVVTDLSAATLANYDVLSLPDNAVPDEYIADVAAWFVPGKVIVCFDSAVSYAEYSGFFWPGYGGNSSDVGQGTLWDYGSCSYDGQIADQDYVTAGYSIGDSVSTIGGDAEFYPEMLPLGTTTFLTAINGECQDFAAGHGQGGAIPSSRTARVETAAPIVYGAYRDVEGHGRMVLLGPYDDPDEYVYDAWPMIRNAHTIGFNASFYDDYARSQFCVDTHGGAYQWTILTGPKAGIYTGTCLVLNGGARFSNMPGDPNTLSFVYDPVRHKAAGYMITGGYYSKLQDANTLNDPAGCQAQLPPTIKQ